ncbi:MAG TPA: PhzF family phenazine biosynthesis protein [Acidimicrobiales bacterium]|nr:PhzF family phenazine biosynthesis protein [Acidimicrobiales bacterium]
MNGKATVPFFWVDAFTDRPFGGNPAAVCLLDGPADEDWMQALASELGLSETAFVWAGGEGWHLRWFTPTTEVDLCGHATLASAHALWQAGLAGREVLAFSTRSGRLTARRVGDLIELGLPAVEPAATIPPAALSARWPVVGAAVGGPCLVVELDSADSVRAIVPQPDVVDPLPHQMVAVTAAGDQPGTDYVLRVFGCGVGIGEDPATGSAQCVLGPYWAARLGRPVLSAAQLSTRVGRLRVRLEGDRVMVGGAAVTILQGRIEVP